MSPIGWIVVAILAVVDGVLARKTSRRPYLEDWQHQISFLPYAVGVFTGWSLAPAHEPLAPGWTLDILLACGAALVGAHWLSFRLGLKPRWSAPWHLLLGAIVGAILWSGV